MVRILYILLGVTLVCAMPVWAQQVFDPSGSDPEAVALAERTMEAMGGTEAWNEVVYLGFDFVAGSSVFSHAWDRKRGWYRATWVERAPRKGGTEHPYPDLVDKQIETIFKMDTMDGVALADGKRIEDPEVVEYLITRKGPRGGYSRFVNDAYWFLMPYKLKDPGVHLHIDDPENGPNGEMWDVVRVTFDDGVGLTSGDTWWAYINRETGLMDRWGMLLQGQTGSRRYTDWTEWRQFGPIQLAVERKNVGRSGGLRFENIVVSDTVPPGVFDALEAR